MKYLSVLVVAAALLLGGCRTSQVIPVRTYEKNSEVAPSGRELAASLEAENYCVYLFGFLPILSGDGYRPNAKRYVMFKNTVNDYTTKRMMDVYARRVLKVEGIEDYKSTTVYTGWYSLWIVSRRTIKATALAVDEKIN